MEEIPTFGKRWGLIVWTIIMLFASGVACTAGAEAPLLISAGGARALPASGPIKASSVEVALELDFKTITGGTVTNGMQVRIEPEPGVLFTATVVRVSIDVNGVFGLAADVEGYPFGSFLLSVANDVAFGELTLPSQQRRYTIRYLEDTSQHVARDVYDRDLDHLPPGPPIVPPAPPKGTPVAQTEKALAGPLDPVTVDLMIVYTPAAASWATTYGGGIANVIAAGTAGTGQLANLYDPSASPFSASRIYGIGLIINGSRTLEGNRGQSYGYCTHVARHL